MKGTKSTPEIFISYGGPIGSRIGDLVLELLNKVYKNSVKVHKSDRSLGVGKNWFGQLTKIIKDSDICIALIDPGYLQSPWSSFELGAFYVKYEFESLLNAANEEEYNDFDELYPIDLLKHRNSFRTRQLYKGPVENIQSKPLKVETFLSLDNQIKYILEKRLSQKKLDFDYKESLKEHWSHFYMEVTKILDTADRILMDKKNSLTPSDISKEFGSLDYADFLQHLKDRALINIESNFMRSIYLGLEKLFVRKNESRLDIVLINHAKNLLKWTEIDMQAASTGDIRVTRLEDIQDMWKREVMGNVNRSLWTTNTKGSNGRKSDRHLIRRQKALVERLNGAGGYLKRIFVYDKTDWQDLEELKPTIEEQLIIGIDLFLLEQEHFLKYRFELEERLEGGYDFMIIDNCYVYITHARPDSKKVSSVRLKDRDDYIQSALEIAESIENDSNIVHLEKLPIGDTEQDKMEARRIIEGFKNDFDTMISVAKRKLDE